MKLLTILLFSFGCYAQGNFDIPSNFVGTWIKSDGSDTITITNEKVLWTSDYDGQPYESYVMEIVRSNATTFNFKVQPNADFVLSLVQDGRLKLKFFAQENGLRRCEGIYIKESRNKKTNPSQSRNFTFKFKLAVKSD